MTGGFTEIRENLRRMEEQLYAAAWHAAEEIAALLESWSKMNAPFTDRTGNLRQSIRGTAEQTRRDLYTVILTAGMEYAIFVERVREGKYAYLWPAVTENQARIRAIWQARLTV